MLPAATAAAAPAAPPPDALASSADASSVNVSRATRAGNGVGAPPFAAGGGR